MTAFLRRIAYWLGWHAPEVDFPDPREMGPQWTTGYTNPVPPEEPSDWAKEFAEKWRAQYLADFGPNVPVEDLGGKPVSEAAARFYAAERSEGIERALQFIEECPAFTFEGSVRMGLPRGDSPVFYENGQPVYPGKEKAP